MVCRGYRPPESHGTAYFYFVKFPVAQASSLCGQRASSPLIPQLNKVELPAYPVKRKKGLLSSVAPCKEVLISSMPHLKNFQSGPPEARRVGMITQWFDEKGYGWVESGGKRYFAHIKEFEPGQRRPKSGEEVRFIPGIDLGWRPYAKGLTLVKAGKVPSGTGALVLFCLLLVLPLLALFWLPLPWWMGAGGMLIVSAITYAMYAHDKKQAVSQGWRISESSLHLGELLGGWPGAFIAQWRLRHKCSKPGYQFVYRTIVLLYQIAALDVILHQRLSKAVMAYLNR